MVNRATYTVIDPVVGTCTWSQRASAPQSKRSVQLYSSIGAERSSRAQTLHREGGGGLSKI